jgi:hypothetical protein
MLKMVAKGDRDGKAVRVVMLGLSHENLRRLTDGRPIKFNGSTVRLPDDIEFVIFAGNGERAMQREMIDLVGPETAVKIDSRLAD